MYSLVKPLAKIGVEVINCSRKTALQAFPQGRLEDVLGDWIPVERSEAGVDLSVSA